MITPASAMYSYHLYFAFVYCISLVGDKLYLLGMVQFCWVSHYAELSFPVTSHQRAGYFGVREAEWHIGRWADGQMGGCTLTLS